MIAGIKRTLHERFVHPNTAKRHNMILFLFVIIIVPCRIGMFLSSSKNRREPRPVFYQTPGRGTGRGLVAVLFGRRRWRRRWWWTRLTDFLRRTDYRRWACRAWRTRRSRSRLDYRSRARSRRRTLTLLCLLETPATTQCYTDDDNQ